MKNRMSLWTTMSLCFFLSVFLTSDIADAKTQSQAAKTIALNFDDGPQSATLKELLPVLKKYNIPATFFLEGALVSKNQELVKKMHNDGFEIENHSWSHENFIKLFKQKGQAAVKSSLNKTSEEIFKATGRKPLFCRPPFWEINKEIEKIIEADGYTVMKLDNPDINTMDYADAAKRRPAQTLIERVKKIILSREQKGISAHILVFHELKLTAEALDILIPYFKTSGYKFIRLDEMYPLGVMAVKPAPRPDGIRAIYLASNYLFSEKKIAELEQILAGTGANGIVVDFKDSNRPAQDKMTELVKRFKKQGAYTIARIVTFQDSYFARVHPEIAVKTSSGDLWCSGQEKWKRYWLDPASQLAQDYNVEVAKRAIDCGFDEIQFDYVRFPTDGDMKNIQFPFYDSRKQSKSAIMNNFFKKIRTSLKAYSPGTLIGIDVFGEVFVYGKEAGIGQTLEEISEYFDVISPMAYPSHYCCGEFGVQDPTAYPYKVYYTTLKNGLKFLGNKKIIIRPWLQDFTLRSIYRCGPTVPYGTDEILAQIQACRDLDVNGFMLWNAGSKFTVKAMEKITNKNRPSGKRFLCQIIY